MLDNPLPFTPLKSLKPYKNAWRIQVKLLHVWRQYSVKAGESIEMILVDEAMYAAVRREHIKKFERCLTEGVWKIITTITLNPTSGQYRISDLKYKISFVFKTTVSPCDTVSDALFLSLAKFDVVNRSEIQDLNANNKSTKKNRFRFERSAVQTIYIHIHSYLKFVVFLLFINKIILSIFSDTRLACTLWGKYAEIVDQACQESTDGIVVCLIRFAKINLYNVLDLFTRGSMHQELAMTMVIILGKQSRKSTHLMMYHSLIYVVANLFITFSYLKLSLLIPLYIHLKVGKCKTVCLIRQLIQIGRGTIFVVVLTTRRLSKKKLSNLKMSSYLKSQDFGVKYAIVLQNLLIWLHLHIMDQSGEARCMLFDSHAKEILGITAHDLLSRSFDEIEDPTVLPDVINGLKGKTFQFLLCIQRENIFGGYDSFTVARVYTGNIADEIVQEDSDAYVDPSSLISIEQGSLMLTNGVDLSDVDLSSTSTPSSKRKEDDVDGNDQASISRNKCSKMTMSEEVSGE
ncbi:putative nucleic acid-binding, replication factor A [Arabidopsis thaliana]